MDNTKLIAEARQYHSASMLLKLANALEAAEAELTRRDTSITEGAETQETSEVNAVARLIIVRAGWDPDEPEDDTEEDIKYIYAEAAEYVEAARMARAASTTEADITGLLDMVSEYGKLSMRAAVKPIDQNLVAQNDAFYAVWEAIRNAVAAAASVSLEVVKAQAHEEGYQRGIDAARAAFPRVPDGAAAPVSLEAAKAETTTEWNAVRQDATGELWDVYEPFDSREDAERVAAEWRGNNEPGDDPVVVVERTKGVAPGEWRIADLQEHGYPQETKQEERS